MNRRIMVGIILIVILSFGLFNIASAHAELVSSAPAAGAKLTSAPSKVTLVFSEEISENPDESNFTVTNEQGTVVGTGKLDTTDLDHKTQTGTLQAGLGDGVYTVKWNAVTTDDNGHTSGSFTFGVNKDPGAQPTAMPEPTEMEAATSAAATTASAAQPTTQPAVVATATPETLPKTAEGGSFGWLYILIIAVAVLVGGIILRRLIRAPR